MEQVNILCDQFPENLSYQAQKASEIMQNGDHKEAINLFNNIVLIIKDKNVFIVASDNPKILKLTSLQLIISLFIFLRRSSLDKLKLSELKLHTDDS